MDQISMAGIAYRWPQPKVINTLSGHRLELVYKLVQTTEALREMREALCASTMIVYDSETSGLQVHLGARVIGHAFACYTGPTQVTAWYVPIRHIGGANDSEPQLPVEEAAEACRAVLTSPGVCGFFHAKFDLGQLRMDGIFCERAIQDVATLATAHNENEPTFALKNLSAKYCNVDARAEASAMDDWMRKDARTLGIPFSQRRKERDGLLGEETYKERFGYARTPVRMCGEYACKDVFYTLYLLTVKYADTAGKWPAVVQRENKVTNILHDMEWHGLPVDADLIRRSHDVCRGEYEHWLGEARRMTGIPTFENTDDEVRTLFFEKLGLPPPKQTKKGQNSVDRETRLLLTAKYPEHKPLLDVLGKLQRATKLYTTYTANFLRFVSPTTGCIHANYNQLEQKDKGGVPVTGRLSSANPNMQNIDSRPLELRDGSRVEIRRYFVVPDGHIRFYIDFSQIELRVLTWYCQDPVLLECYQLGLDVHQIIADQLGILRKIAKQVNFGNSYGMTEIGLAIRLPGYYEDPEGTREFAKRILDAYFKRYKNIRIFRDQAAELMRCNGGLFVSPFGRPRRIPTIASGENWERERAMRMMMSSIVSGTAADLMKESMIRCADILKDDPLGGRMVQTIHDELVFDVPLKEGWASLLIKLVRAMEDWPMFSSPSDRQGVPIQVSTELSTTTWADKREVEVLPDDTLRWAA